MQIPKVYLISRNLTAEQKSAAQAALALTPLAAIITPDIRDSQIAKEYCETVAPLDQPIAILADFEEPLTALNPDGTKCPVL